MLSPANRSTDQIEMDLLSNRNHSWQTLEQMYKEESLTDVIISCGEDEEIKAHKLVLSSWSKYFKRIFASNDNHSCNRSHVFLKDIPFNDLKILIELMYCGRASINKQQFDSVERSARALSITDLTQLLIPLNRNVNPYNNNQSHHYHQPKRKRFDNTDHNQDNDVFMDANQSNLSEHIFSSDNKPPETDNSGDKSCATETNSENNQILKQKPNEVQNDQSSYLSEESISDSALNLKNNIQSIISKRKETKLNQKETNVSAKTLKQIESNRDPIQEINGAQTKITQNQKTIQSSDDNNNQKCIMRVNRKKARPKKVVEPYQDSTESQSKSKSSEDLDTVFSRCLRSSTQQSSRFSQLSYEERQHHFKLQQIKYQDINQTSQSDSLNTNSNNTQNDKTSEKLLIQLNPNDVLCDSEGSDCDYGENNGSKSGKLSKASSEKVEVKQTAIVVRQSQTKTNPVNEDQTSLALPAPTTRLLINNGSVSAIKPNTSGEPLYLYNLVPNALSFRPTSTTVSVPTTSAIMYISEIDPKVVQKRDPNTSSSEKKLVPNWTSIVKKTNIAPKLTAQSSAAKISQTLLSNADTKPLNKKVTLTKGSCEKVAQKIATPQTSLKKSPPNRARSPKKRNSYPCTKCTKAYSSNQTLIDHEKIVHQNSSENYACKICGKAVKWKDSLRSHFKTNHPDIDSTNMIEVL